MPPAPQPPARDAMWEHPSRRLSLATALMAAGFLLILIAGFMALESSLGRDTQVEAAVPGEGAPSTTTPAPTTTTSTTTTSTTTTLPAPAPTVPPQPPDSGYVVAPSEAEPEAKQLAADIAYFLTTYQGSDDHLDRLTALAGNTDLDALLATAAPLVYQGSWSRGEVIYPQLGGLRNGRASVMVVTRQTVGADGDVDFFSVVRTLDIRLVLGDSGWQFAGLGSAGGAFDGLEELALAHGVAADPRIEMPDSARLDILAGLVSPVLLELMADIADRTPYAVAVLATGHPHNVFETERLSDHTVGRAIDIIRIGDRNVVDDRDEGSATYAIVEWLLSRSDIRQVGSPWDLDGAGSQRSFSDPVHQDHLHVAVALP